MSAMVLGGPIYLDMDRDDEGHRTYTVRYLVQTTSVLDGPAIVSVATGLPRVGAFYSFGNDIDLYAHCRPEMKISIADHQRGEPTKHWIVELKFSTKPLSQCQNDTIEDPLLQPAVLSGSFIKYVKEVLHDRNGNLITNSAFQRIRGKIMEFDHNRSTIQVEQNLADLQSALVAEYMDSVNDSPLWGFPARTVKLSGGSWSKKYYGTCNVYYSRTLSFDVDYTTFDRTAPDEGTKALHGQWSLTEDTWELIDIDGETPVASNPAHYSQYKDRNGENASVMLNGAGLPAETTVGTGSTGEIGEIEISHYPGVNFLLLGIPNTI